MRRAPRRREAATVATSPTTFGRLFPDLPAFAPATQRVKDALLALGAPGGPLDAEDDLSKGPKLLITDPGLSANNPNNPTHTAGTTFMGQFIDHDITFDTTSPMGVPTDPGELAERAHALARPRLRLRGGPVASPQLYDPSDRAKLRIESAGIFEDLPRERRANTAIIADPRNDENLMIAGLQCAFILFHNNAVEWARANGYADAAFAQARQLTTWHYHWIVLHEFLPLVVGQALVDDVLRKGRRFYRPRLREGFIPVEFQAAAYRFGHSMVRPSYRANLKGDDGNPFFAMVFDPARRGASRSGRSARRGSRPAPLHRLADVLRLRRRGGEAEQEDRHEDLDAALRSPARRDREPRHSRRRCRSATCCAS